MTKIIPVLDKVIGGITAFLQGTPTDWRLGAVREPYPHGTQRQQKRLEEIFGLAIKAGLMADKNGTRNIYGPDPSKANAKILTVDSPYFCQPITLPGDDSIILWRGPEAYADGMIVPINTAIWLVTADCAILIAVDVVLGIVIVAHAGRDSMTHADVIGTVMKTLDSLGSKLKNRWCWIGFTIHHQNFKHPLDHQLYGLRNRELIKKIEARWPSALPGVDKSLGQISLRQLAKAQLLEHGVKKEHIFFEDTDTYADREIDGPRKGEYSFWSARREREDHERGIGIGTGERNGVMIVNRGVERL